MKKQNVDREKMLAKCFLALIMFTVFSCVSSECIEESLVTKRAPEKIQERDAKRQKCLSELIERFKTKSGDFICFVEDAFLTGCTVDVGAGLIDWYIKDNEQNASFTHQYRLELALYCALKSVDLRKKDDKKEGADLNPFMQEEPVTCPFAAQALTIVRSLLADKPFDDKSQPQVFTLAYLPFTAHKLSNGRLLDLSAALPYLQDFLLKRMNNEALAHCIGQLIGLNEEAALNCLEKTKLNYHFWTENFKLYYEFWRACFELLCRWADLFNRRQVLHWILSLRIDGLRPMVCDCKNSQKTMHTLLSIERAAYLGNIEPLGNIKDIKRIRVRNLGWKRESGCFDLLELAAILGYSKLAQFCIERELEVTQYHVLNAMDYGHMEVLKLLLSHFKGRITDDSYDFRAIKMGYLDAIKCVIDKMDAAAIDQLVFCAINESAGVTVIKFLLDEIENVVIEEESRTEIFRNGLIRAVRRAELDVLACFTSRSVALNGFLENPSFQDLEGNPLHAAVRSLLIYIRDEYTAEELDAEKSRPLDEGEVDERDEILNEKSNVIAFLLECGVQDEPDEAGRTVMTHLKEGLKELSVRIPKINEKIRVVIEQVMRMLTEHEAKEPKAHERRVEKFSQGLVHFPKQPSDIVKAT